MKEGPYLQLKEGPLVEMSQEDEDRSDSHEEDSFVRPWKARPLRLKGKARFGGRWSSELAWAVVLYKPRDDDIVFLHSWKQGSKDDDKMWVKPFFPPASYERLLSYARQRYLDGYKKLPRKEDTIAELKDHRQDLCEMCKELGHACNDRKGKQAGAQTARS